jgi:hypothetical protein
MSTPKQIHEWPVEFDSLESSDYLPASKAGVSGKITRENFEKNNPKPFLPSAAAILRTKINKTFFVSNGISKGELRFNDDVVNGNPTEAYIHKLSDAPYDFYINEFFDRLPRNSCLYFVKDADNIIGLVTSKKVPIDLEDYFTIPISYAFQIGDINAGDVLGITCSSNGTEREQTNSDYEYYVRSDGSDDNNGYNDSPSGAFKTWQYAIDFVASSFDTDYNVTIIAGGSGVRQFNLTESINIKCPAGNGRLVLRGNPSNPSECIFSGSGTHLLKASHGKCLIDGFRFTSPFVNPNTIFLQCNEGLLQFQNVDFGALTQGSVPTSQMHVYANGGDVQLIGNYKISGGMGLAHIFAKNGGRVFRPDFNATVTITNNPTFDSTIFLSAGAIYDIPNLTWSGTTVGKKFTVELNSILRSQSSSANIPGSIAGVVQTGGQLN